jgi:hypothetical protein
MLVRVKKIHPALKHAGYSATTLLPGEDSAAFEELHRALIAEFTPVGALEEDIIADMARLTWRKQNLATFRVAKLLESVPRKLLSRRSRPPILMLIMLTEKKKSERGTKLQRSKPGKNSGHS